ncbi:hypothetical protein MFLO_06059 [Listeria floridensis FSL S10-1187]|uniref:SWIM-type domain-containing protein n=1 Tax=Listeria floridensis FSL S10-1187 TaxID=1265817 RepID=A0ABN0RGC2_9LIST|nr:hypothetical protein MFLO_06059 [Listeria floridensis FSL S10-1187]
MNFKMGSEVLSQSVNIQDEMISYHVKQDAKQLLREQQLEKRGTTFHFEDGEEAVKLGEDLYDCTCRAHEYGERVCKHIYAAFLKEEELRQEEKKTKFKGTNFRTRIACSFSFVQV